MSKEHHIIVVKKKARSHQHEHHGGAWKVAFADFDTFGITLDQCQGNILECIGFFSCLVTQCFDLISDETCTHMAHRIVNDCQVEIELEPGQGPASAEQIEQLCQMKVLPEFWECLIYFSFYLGDCEQMYPAMLTYCQEFAE